MKATRGELKHLSTPRNRKKVLDFLSSGERKGNSLNRNHAIASGRYDCGVAGCSVERPESLREGSIFS